MYRVTLKPHIGRTMHGEEIEHDQWMIFANGRHVGYVGKQPNAPVSLFEVSKAEELAIRRSINRRLNSERRFAVAPTDEDVRNAIKKRKGK